MPTEKVESLEQAAREIVEIVQLHVDHSGSIDDPALTEQEVAKQLAERERQVWAEAANIADQTAGSWLSTGSFKDSDVVGALQGLEETFRTRAEQGK